MDPKRTPSWVAHLPPSPMLWQLPPVTTHNGISLHPPGIIIHMPSTDAQGRSTLGARWFSPWPLLHSATPSGKLSSVPAPQSAVSVLQSWAIVLQNHLKSCLHDICSIPREQALRLAFFVLCGHRASGHSCCPRQCCGPDSRRDFDPGYGSVVVGIFSFILKCII